MTIWFLITRVQKESFSQESEYWLILSKKLHKALEIIYIVCIEKSFCERKSEFDFPIYESNLKWI
jgi:hypothetical protein